MIFGAQAVHVRMMHNAHRCPSWNFQ